MKDSSFNTVSVPQLVLTTTTPVEAPPGSPQMAATFLVQSGVRTPMRVLVRNISFAAEVYLAFDAATLQTNEPGGNTYFLPAGAADAFVLAPDQKLYAISLSAGAKVCVAISEALPADIKP